MSFLIQIHFFNKLTCVKYLTWSFRPSTDSTHVHTQPSTNVLAFSLLTFFNLHTCILLSSLFLHTVNIAISFGNLSSIRQILVSQTCSVPLSAIFRMSSPPQRAPLGTYSPCLVAADRNLFSVSWSAIAVGEPIYV